MSMIITPDDIDFNEYMQETEAQVKVLSASTWDDELEELLRHGSQLRGATLPWAKTHDLLRFRPGEVSLWQGMNGHGKSQVLGQAILGFIAQGQKSCIASFEMQPRNTLMRMLRQVSMTNSPSVNYAKKMTAWMEGKLWLYDQVGSADPKTIAAVIRYCVDKLGIDHFVIDSLMRCVAGEDDYNGQKNFVEQLCRMAQDYEIHIHLVHHARKQENENQAPGKFDAKGSGAIVDQVDQMLTVWRNKPKEDAVRKVLITGTEADIPDDLRTRPDCRIICDKNRHGEWEGGISLWFHPDSLQYTPDNRAMPLPIMPQ